MEIDGTIYVESDNPGGDPIPFLALEDITCS